MKRISSLLFVAIFLVLSADAQERDIDAQDNHGLVDTGLSMVFYAYLADGAMLHVRAADGSESTLEVPEESQLRILGHKMEERSGETSEGDNLFEGNLRVSIVPASELASEGSGIFNRARTDLRFKNATILLRRAEPR